MNKQMKVDAIKDGTVIDHIPAGLALRVVDILGLHTNNPVLVGMNFSSQKQGRKDILKIENRELTQAEVNRIALLAPNADLAIIRDFTVVAKFKVEVPDVIEGLVHCPNPACITNQSPVTTRFLRQSRERIRCYYCEKPYDMHAVEIISK